MTENAKWKAENTDLLLSPSLPLSPTLNTFIYIYTYTHIHTYMFVCIYMYTHIYVYIYTNSCTYIYLKILCIYEREERELQTLCIERSYVWYACMSLCVYMRGVCMRDWLYMIYLCIQIDFYMYIPLKRLFWVRMFYMINIIYILVGWWKRLIKAKEVFLIIRVVLNTWKSYIWLILVYHNNRE